MHVAWFSMSVVRYPLNVFVCYKVPRHKTSICNVPEPMVEYKMKENASNAYKKLLTFILLNDFTVIVFFLSPFFMPYFKVALIRLWDMFKIMLCEDLLCCISNTFDNISVPKNFDIFVHFELGLYYISDHFFNVTSKSLFYYGLNETQLP